METHILRHVKSKSVLNPRHRGLPDRDHWRQYKKD
jgi:hypothetical protein